MLKKKSMFHTKKPHRSALAQQKPKFHRSFVLIWNKNRDTPSYLCGAAVYFVWFLWRISSWSGAATRARFTKLNAGLSGQFLGGHGYFWADSPNRTGFRPEQQPRPGPKYCSARLTRPKLPVCTRQCVELGLGTGSPNMKLVLV